MTSPAACLSVRKQAAHARLGRAVLVLRAQILEHLRPEVRVAAARRVAQAHARLYQRRVVPCRHVHLQKAGLAFTALTKIVGSRFGLDI